MALSQPKVAAELTTRTVSWTIKTPYGNAIIVKWRKTGSGVAWATATMAELPKTATTCLIAGLADVKYDVQVTQVDYGTSETMAATTPPVGPPASVTPPIVT